MFVNCFFFQWLTDFDYLKCFDKVQYVYLSNMKFNNHIFVGKHSHSFEILEIQLGLAKNFKKMLRLVFLKIDPGRLLNNDTYHL